MKILLLNLTRFGDLLQTQPIITGLHQEGHEVGLACLAHFAPAAALLENVHCLAAFPDANLLRNTAENWPAALGELHEWKQEVNSVLAPELIINLTPTLSARMLARYLSPPAANPLGFGVDEFGFGVNSNAWTTFLQASSRKRGNCPYNLVDVFRKICGLGAVPPVYRLHRHLAGNAEVGNTLQEAARQALTQFAQKQTGTPAPDLLTGLLPTFKGFAAFQLGASDDRRRWPSGYFARLGDLLWQRFGLVPLLLGAKNEAHLARKYAAAAKSPFIDLIGATDLPGLAASLLSAEVLITNDTGTMHLAAGLGVPTLAIFLATAQPWDTAAYQEDICCLEPDLPDHPRAFDAPCPENCACRRLIEPETVFELTAARLEKGQWQADPATLAKKQARIWLTCRQASDIDPEMFLDLKSLSGHEQTDRATWLRMQRYFLRHFLDNTLTEQNKASAPYNLTKRHASLSPDFLDAVKSELREASLLLHLLQEQGNALAQHPIPLLKTRFMGTWQRLQTLWDNSPHFNVLGHLWICQTQELGDDLGTVLGLAAAYAELSTKWNDMLTP